MAKIDVINLKGEKTSDLKLNDNIWKIETNDIVLKKAIDLQLASLRQGTHKTKTRGEVSGGGRKPYRQKGTGNARQGTIRAPHYRGGGVVFGVTPRSYTIDSVKTKDIKKLMADLKLAGKVLFVTENDAENLYLATRNLGYALVLMANELNVYDIVNADTMVVEEGAVKYIEEVLK